MQYYRGIPIFELGCLVSSGYKGVLPSGIEYLGIDRVLVDRFTATLTVKMSAAAEMEEFSDFWVNIINNGIDHFIVSLPISGFLKEYIVRPTTDVRHSLPDNVPTVVFSVEVLGLVTDLENNVPVANSVTVYVEENSQDNFIRLSGSDLDILDILTYDVEVSVGNGTISGTAPNLVYTPAPGYVGQDCLTFTVSDFISTSLPGLITIEVGTIQVSDAVVEYKTTAPFRVTGNYHWDRGDGIWVRGTGGLLTPLTDTIKIASPDHRLDERDMVVTSCTVISWGQRTIYTDFLKNQAALVSFSVGGSAGVCAGVMFDGMFEGTMVSNVPVFDTSSGTNFRRMFANSSVTFMQNYDLSSGIYFESMFEGATYFVTSPKVNSIVGEYFKDMYKNASAFECLGGIDTSKQLTTSNMFSGAISLANPDATEQQTILDGVDWTSSSPCAVSVDTIVHTSGTETCQVANLGGTCTSSGSYQVQYSNQSGAVSFAWTVSNGTITGGQGTSTVTVSSVSSDVPENVVVSCVVTDSVSSTNSGDYSFEHDRTYGYLTLNIPKQTDLLNLRTFIDANNPGSETEILLINDRVNGPMETGSLSGLTVELRNTGEIQGINDRRFADASLPKHSGLTITSAIKVVNTGKIKGSGGTGGKGADGADDAYTTNEKEIRGSTWATDCYAWRDCISQTQIAWNGVVIHVAGNQTGPYTVGGVANLYRGAYSWTRTEAGSVAEECTGAQTPMYLIERRYTQSNTRLGGEGGLGGAGAGYNDVTADAGSAGSASNPTGGNSGGTGGTGGDWGVDGGSGASTSGGSGAAGYDAGYAVSGSGLLSGGSDLGTAGTNTYGDIL